MTREELREYIKGCPYDAMGDYSSLLDDGLDSGGEEVGDNGNRCEYCNNNCCDDKRACNDNCNNCQCEERE